MKCLRLQEKKALNLKGAALDLGYNVANLTRWTREYKEWKLQMDRRLESERKEQMENAERKLESEPAGYDEVKSSKWVDNMNTKSSKTSIAYKLSKGNALLRPVKKNGEP